MEKSRSVIQPELERNFHIFYQLCQGADDDIRTTLKLQPATSYDYLNQSGCLEVDSISDEEEFQSTRMAMKTLGLTLSQQLAIFKLISAHLHLGNIVFEEDTLLCEEYIFSLEKKDYLSPKIHRRPRPDPLGNPRASET